MKLLIIGEINSEINAAIDIAKRKKAKIVMVSNSDEAILYLVGGKGVNLLLMDFRMDIKKLKASMDKEKISTPIIAYGVHCSPKDAVKAIREGAQEFMPLPPDEKLIAAIFAALSDDSISVIGESKQIEEILKVADKIANSSVNILITGESGTGKEVFAHYIHKKSDRKNKGFVSVNCAAIPENLIESELFGHEKGAFTGAMHRRIGKFEEANGGTLLLDEISEMDIKLQAKLLRAIQEKEIDRVGGSTPVKIDIRIIATSNRDLLKEIEVGNFREDLYFRLNIINIELPSLNERENDILLLSEYFINKYTENNGKSAKTLSPEVKEKLLKYKWPGNVRELENVIHRAILMSDTDEIQSRDIHLKELNTQNKNDLIKGDSNEKQMIFNTLGYCLGDMTKAANILGVSIDGLRKKLKDYCEEAT